MHNGFGSFVPAEISDNGGLFAGSLPEDSSGFHCPVLYVLIESIFNDGCAFPPENCFAKRQAGFGSLAGMPATYLAIGCCMMLGLVGRVLKTQRNSV